MGEKTISINTLLGVAEMPFKIRISNPAAGRSMWLLPYQISDFSIESDIFSLRHRGHVVVRDEFGIQLGLGSVPKNSPLLVNMQINDLDFGETYISESMTASKSDQASRDTGLRIDFVNRSWVVAANAFVRGKIDANVKVAEYLRRRLEQEGLSISRRYWKPGDMEFSSPYFVLGSLPSVIDQIKAMDSSRDVGNLFVCYCDFAGELCYSEISERSSRAVSDRKILKLATSGGLFGLGGLLTPRTPSMWSFTSPDIEAMVEKSNGFKFYQYNRHRKLMVPMPGKDGLSPDEVLAGSPTMGGRRLVRASDVVRGVDEFAIQSAGDDGAASDYGAMGSHALSRDPVLNDWFNNNSYNIRLGFISTDLDINRTVGFKVDNDQGEVYNKALGGTWLLAGIRHSVVKTNAYTDLFLIRNSEA